MESSNLSFLIKKVHLRQEIIVVHWIHKNWYCEVNGLIYNGFRFQMQWHTNLNCLFMLAKSILLKEILWILTGHQERIL